MGNFQAKCIIVANMLADKRWKPRKTTLDGILIIEIPSLLIEGSPIKINDDAMIYIRRCLDEYRI